MNSEILHLDVFTAFFSQFPNYESFYKLPDITALGEIYVIDKDEVNYKAFYDRLVQIKREKNLLRG